MKITKIEITIEPSEGEDAVPRTIVQELVQEYNSMDKRNL